MATVTRASAVTMPGIELVTKLEPSTKPCEEPAVPHGHPGEREGEHRRRPPRPPPPDPRSAAVDGTMLADGPDARRRRSTASGRWSTPARRAPARRAPRGRRRREWSCRPDDVERVDAARPSRSWRIGRCRGRPPRRPAAPGRAGPERPASVLPAAPLNVAWNCSKIAVVRVAKRSIANAPYSASRCTPISSPPPRIASRSCGSTTRQKAPVGLEPSARADSSIAGSSLRSVAAAGT